jgi:DNA-binding LytR/AlgR family response regulator
MNCLILDDEPHALEVLVHHANSCELLSSTASTSNPAEALNLIASGEVDLLFTDMNMPEVNGADIVRAIAGQCKVIVTSAHTDFAVDGYDYGVVDYLVKPISYTRFFKAVQKACECTPPPLIRMSGSSSIDENSIYIKTGIKNNVVRIMLDEIEYLESLKNYVAIYHGGRKTLAYISMKDIEMSLPTTHFVRIHKSFIVSLKHVSRIEGTEVELCGGQSRIYIGDAYKAKFWNMIRERTVG